MVTGANSGIGKATAMGLARMGAQVILVCRSREKGETAVEEIKNQTRNELSDLLIADLASMNSVRELAKDYEKRYDRLDVLILNAGAYFTKRQLTEDGFERTLAVNYLSRFLLTNLLLDTLKKSAPARIISVVGAMLKEIDFDDFMMEKKYAGRHAVARSTLANMLFIHELVWKEEGTGITANYFDPGAVRTNMAEKDKDLPKLAKFAFKFIKPFFKSPEKAAESILYLASSLNIQNVTGSFFAGKKEIPVPSEVGNESLRKRLWDVSVQLTRL